MVNAINYNWAHLMLMTVVKSVKMILTSGQESLANCGVVVCVVPCVPELRVAFSRETPH